MNADFQPYKGCLTYLKWLILRVVKLNWTNSFFLSN